MIALWVLLAALCCVWLLQALLLVRNLRNMTTLAEQSPSDPPTWPRISVIVPARDEADTIGPALRSRLDDDYPDLEIVVVDDRSADGTGDVVRGIAATDDRVCCVRVDELPPGWLGKVHALEQGCQVASGDWLLLSDADVHVAPGTMRRTVAYCIERELDHLALIPEYLLGSVPMLTVWTVFLRIFGIMVDFKAVRDPAKPKAAMGSGAFNFVRREAFEQTEGFEWLRMDTTDDMTVGVMMKANGFRSEGVDGRGTASVTMYRTVGDFLRGAEKNAGSILGAPEVAVYLAAPAWLLLEWSPFVAVVLGPPWLKVVGAVALIVAMAINVISLRTNTGKTLAALLWPLGSLFFATALVRATWLANRRGGVMWRGTLHTTEEILENRRFRLS